MNIIQLSWVLMAGEIVAVISFLFLLTKITKENPEAKQGNIITEDVKEPKVKELEVRISSLQDEIGGTRVSYNKILDELRGSKKRESDSSEELLRYKKQYDLENTEVQRLKKEEAELKAKIASREQEKEEGLEKMRAQSLALEGELKKKNAELAELKDSKKRESDSSEELLRYKKQYDLENTEVQRLKKEEAELKAKIASEEQEKEEGLEKMRAQSLALEGELKKKNAELEILKKENKELSFKSKNLYEQAEKVKKEKGESPSSHTLNFPKRILELDAKEEDRENCSMVSQKLFSIVKQHGVDNQEKAQEIYTGAIDVIKTLLAKIRAKEDLSEYMGKIYELLDDVFNQIVLGDSLLNNIYEEKKGEYYLPYHIANVLILSSILGLKMGFNKSKLSYFGLASIFCDLGIDSMEQLVNQPKTFTQEEHEIVKTHISRSLGIVNSIGVLNEIVKETIAMHHERAGGGGYPRGIGSDDINPYAKVLGLIDVYDAITHTRPYREGMNTHKAVRALTSSLRNDFDTGVMKVFINKMSVYPIGSVVRLDTQELARVISVQAGSPLRPVVVIIQDASGKPVKEANIIDLAKQDFPAIEE